MEELIHYFSRYLKLTEAEKEALHTQVRVQSFSKGQLLLEKGDVSTAFFFIIKGCVRLYYTVEGEEITSIFYLENQMVSSYKSYIRQEPATHSLQCIEDAEIAVFDQKTAYYFLAHFPRFEALARMIMEDELALYQDSLASFVIHKPEQRYLHLLETQPELIARVPQHALARLIGVTPESLSRIRKRLQER